MVSAQDFNTALLEGTIEIINDRVRNQAEKEGILAMLEKEKDNLQIE